MGFINAWNKPQPSRVTPFDLQRAEQLATTLKKHKRIPGLNVTKWAEQLAILRKQVGTKQLHHVMDWFCQHVKDPYTPVVLSARSFKAKFVAIEKAMARGGLPSDLPEVTPRAQFVSGRVLERCPWPDEATRDNIPYLVQLSMTAHQTLMDQLEASDDRLGPWIVERIGSDTWFVECWLEAISSWLHLSNKRGRDVLRLAFNPKAKAFTKHARTLAEEFCGDPDRWDRLLEKIST